MTETPTDQTGGPGDGDGPGPGGRIEPIELQTSMQRAYIDYAMAVIVGRALPDVRDGLKPVHRRVLYAMYDGGYRPDRGFSKCSRVVGDVMGQYHPHGDTAIYDTLVRLAQPWVMRAPLIQGQGNFGSPGNDSAAAMRYTECRMAPLALEMVRDIDEDTVDFQPNYDGRSQEPTVLPARYPNLLVNGSAGIAVGMATNIPPHNLREVADGAQWALEHPDATREELQDALIERIKGPDFPNGALIVGRAGHRAGLPHRSRLGHPARGHRDRRGRQRPHLPVDHRAALHGQPRQPRAEDRRARRLRQGPGHRRRPRRLLGRAPASASSSCSSATPSRASCSTTCYKHTELQTNFSANMLALVDGVPRTLTSTSSSATGSPTRSRSSSAARASTWPRPSASAHIFRGLVKALDALDEVIALIRRSPDGRRRPARA